MQVAGALVGPDVLEDPCPLTRQRGDPVGQARLQVGLAQQRQRLHADARVDRGEEAFGVGVVPEDAPHRHAGPGGDLLHGGLGVAFADQGEERVLDRGAAAGGAAGAPVAGFGGGDRGGEVCHTAMICHRE